jgi:hypothetical protein
MNCPSCNLPTPRGKYVNGTKDKTEKVNKNSKTKSKTTSKPKSKGKSKIDWGAFRPGKWINWVLLGGLFVALGLGVYWYVFISSAQPLKPESAMSAMNELRKRPSKEEGKSIDDCMAAELKKSKEAGQLLNYQGWTIKPYNHNTYLISFSFEETNGKKSADWIVDPQNKIFTPITELASATQKE